MAKRAGQTMLSDLSPLQLHDMARAAREGATLAAERDKGRYEERAKIVEWCRTVLALNRNAQLLANDIEAGTHWD